MYAGVIKVVESYQFQSIAEESPQFLGVSQCPDDIGPLVNEPRLHALLTKAGIPVYVGN